MKQIVIALSFVLVGCNEVPGNRAKPNNGSVNTVTGAETMKSQLHRVKNTTVLSTQNEITNAAALPVGYSDIPRLEEADDGSGNSPVSRQTRPMVDCGVDVALSSLQTRIRDCVTKNPVHSEWKGILNGNAGEGDWQLVMRNSSGKEIWQDKSTGYLWSDVISTQSNWCQASGNTESALTEGGIDCLELQAGVSRCEGASVFGIPASEISWRLPSRADYLQADINGMRFIFSTQSLNTPVWTATINGENREEAWAILPRTGILAPELRSASLGVRCLGRRLK
jgi:hypothetical protein